MNKRLSLLPLLCLTLTLAAQKNKKEKAIPDFGKVEQADLEMKICDFDEKAEAMVLLEDGQLDFVPATGLELKKRVRIKILSEKGFNQANIHIPYYSFGNESDIVNLDAQTYNLDAAGNIVTTKVEKKLIFEKKLNKKWSEKVFTFPEVKVGSIIEFKYKQRGVGLLDWYFQRSIPVKFSRFALDFPDQIEIHTTPFCSGKYEQTFESKYGRIMQTYTMTNEPAFRKEPFIINEDFYRDRLETKQLAFTYNGRRESTINNWVRVIKDLMEDDDFGVQLKKNIPRTAELDAQLKTITSPYARMKTIYKYVQNNMTWNEFDGIWAFDGVKSAWKDKKGTVGEINLILVNLLKDADIKAHPVLVSTHDHGVVNTGDAGTFRSPGYHQFNKVMAYVEIDDRTYVLDASQRETPAHLIPNDVLVTEGMVIERLDTYEWGWRVLWDDRQVARNVVQLVGVIDADGKMDAEATITSYDHARLSRIGTARKGKEKYSEQFLKLPGIDIGSVEFDNLESDSLPLVQHVKFSKMLDASGEYRHFTPNLLSGLETNPFLSDTRSADIFFGSNQNYVISGTFTLPEGYELEQLPKNMKMIMPDTSIIISRISQLNSNILLTKIQLEFKKPVFGADEYPALQEFYKQLYAILDEQYVIRKKK